MPWFQRRRAVAEQEQHRLWRQARMNTDVLRLISKMPELEVIDLFNAIERHLLREMEVLTQKIPCSLFWFQRNLYWFPVTILIF